MVVVVLILWLFVLGGGDSNLVGTWQGVDPEDGYTIISFRFNQDGSWYQYDSYSEEFLKIGTWDSDGSRLCLTQTELIENIDVNIGTQCVQFQLTDGGNTLILKSPVASQPDLELTKV